MGLVKFALVSVMGWRVVGRFQFQRQTVEHHGIGDCECNAGECNEGAPASSGRQGGPRCPSVRYAHPPTQTGFISVTRFRQQRYLAPSDSTNAISTARAGDAVGFKSGAVTRWGHNCVFEKICAFCYSFEKRQHPHFCISNNVKKRKNCVRPHCEGLTPNDSLACHPKKKT